MAAIELSPALRATDPEVAALVERENFVVQPIQLMMIPSVNHTSLAVRSVLSSRFTDRYAEGYPRKRYYEGNDDEVDDVELLTQKRAEGLFGAAHVNVQAYSGSPGNIEIYNALIEPGDTIMGLDIGAGGHLTHGAAASATSRIYKSEQYGVAPDGRIDYDGMEKKALEKSPKVIIAGTTSYSRLLDWQRFREVADKVGAYLVADISHIAGLVVGDAYPSPFPYADVVMTTTHKTLRGPRGALIMVTKRGLEKYPDLGKRIDESVFPGFQGGPHINTIAAIAVALREASADSFKQYAKQIVTNARALSDALQKGGLNIVTGGTDSHLMVVDLRNKDLIGNTVAKALARAGIITNRNGIPNDPNPPFYPSGLRLGTPALTSRGMKEEQMKLIAGWIVRIINDLNETKTKLGYSSGDEKRKDPREKIIAETPSIEEIRKEVERLCAKFPIPDVYLEDKGIVDSQEPHSSVEDDEDPTGDSAAR